MFIVQCLKSIGHWAVAISDFVLGEDPLCILCYTFPMKTQHIGILHPGAMGISIAASAQNSGQQVYWASEGLGSATQERAAKFGLRDVRTLAALCAECPILISVCPPHVAEDVA